MLRSLLLLAAVAAPLTAAAAPASPPELEAAFANTIVSTYPSGRSAKLWLNRDGSFTGQGAKGARTRGKWAVKDGRLCLTTSPVLPSYCSPLVKVKLGGRWNSVSLKNEPLRNRLVRGRAGEGG
jgi:hypothetical protein